MIRGILITVLIAIVLPSIAQKSKKNNQKKGNATPALFSVGGQQVGTAEFVYLYKKNHPAPEDYTAVKIQEYLDLYINFKLKVTEAISRGMDTTAAFKKEYNSYKDELRKPYLPDTKIIDSLVRLTYERLKFEINASHILIGIKENATPADTLAAFKKCLAMKEQIAKGEDFGALAQRLSEDPSAKQNQGSLGYFTALQMVYPFETAAYQAKVGEVVGPVRTQFGYHLIKVFDKRPSSGEVEVAHIMLRVTGTQNEEAVKNQIFKIHEQATNGMAWDELCKQFSEDPGSKDVGGVIRPFGIRGMASVPEFEESAFALKNEGDISDPFRTAYGWHILRLERKIPMPSYETLEPSLKNKVSRDQRVQLSKQQFYAKLKKQYKFHENEAIKTASLKAIQAGADYSSMMKETLFDIDGTTYTVQNFVDYATHTTSTGNNNMAGVYDSYVQECIMKLEEKRILVQHPEYAMLLKEYYEGILLFEIMEKEVWNKASEDTVGLQDYFTKNADQYTATERADIAIYSSQKSDFQSDLRVLLQAGDSSKTATYATKRQIRVERGLFQKGDRPLLSMIDWSVGVHSTENNGMYYLAEIFDILPPGKLTFEEAKVSVLTDFQEYLEAGWIEKLKLKYPIKIDEKGKKYVFEQLQQ